MSLRLSTDPLQAARQRVFLDYHSWSLWAQGKVTAGIFIAEDECRRMEAALARDAERLLREKMAGYGDE